MHTIRDPVKLELIYFFLIFLKASRSPTKLRLKDEGNLKESQIFVSAANTAQRTKIERFDIIRLNSKQPRLNVNNLISM